MSSRINIGQARANAARMGMGGSPTARQVGTPLPRTPGSKGETPRQSQGAYPREGTLRQGDRTWSQYPGPHWTSTNLLPTSTTGSNTNRPPSTTPPRPSPPPSQPAATPPFLTLVVNQSGTRRQHTSMGNTLTSHSRAQLHTPYTWTNQHH